MGISLDRTNFSSIGVAGTPQPYGFSIREKRAGLPNYPLPSALKMMVVSIDEKHRIKMRVGTKPDVINIEDAETKLFHAMMADPDSTSYTSDVPGHVQFDGPCYFTIVIDIEEWNFLYTEQYDGYDQFIFVDQKPHITSVQDKAGYTIKDFQELLIPYAKNYSFFDAKEAEIDGRNAVRCINYSKRNATGDPLEAGETILYGFNMYITVPLVKLLDDEPRTVVIIDPTSENRGPPVKPPLSGRAG